MFSYKANYLSNFVNKLYRLKGENVKLSILSSSEMLENEKIKKINESIAEASKVYDEEPNEENLKKCNELKAKRDKLKQKLFGSSILLESFKFLNPDKTLNLNDPELRGLYELLIKQKVDFNEILNYYDIFEDKQSFSNIKEAFKEATQKIQKYQMKSFNKIIVKRPIKIDPKTKKEVSNFQEFRKRVLTVYKPDFVKILKGYLKKVPVEKLDIDKENSLDYAKKCYALFDINELKDRTEEAAKLLKTISELQAISKEFKNPTITTLNELLTNIIKLMISLKPHEYDVDFLKTFVKKSDIKLTKALKQKIINCVEKEELPTFEDDTIGEKDTPEEKERKRKLTDLLVSEICDKKITTFYKSEYKNLISHVESRKKQTYIKVGTLSDNEKITGDEKAILGIRLISELSRRILKLKAQNGKKQLNVSLIM